MAYLTRAELRTHIFGEIVDTISDETSDLDNAIKGAISEVYSYLSRFDRTAIFEAVGDDRNPILLLYTKDIAVWHYIQLANPNIDIALRERRYEFATKWLTKVQEGKADPDLPVPLPDDDVQSGDIRYGSARIRQSGRL